METGMLLILCVLIHHACTERKFVFVTQYLDWTSAQTHCRQRSTDLVTVYNEQENQKLMAAAGNVYVCMWIGLRQKLDNWQWSGGAPKLYDKKDVPWAVGQPNNNGHCAAINKYNSGFCDRSCTEKFFFICSDGIVVQQSKTWKEAQDYCRTKNDDLARVTTTTEVLVLVAQLLLTVSDWAWIGLYRDPWSTWSDSTNTSFYNWETEPTISSTDDSCGCLTAATGKWKVARCTDAYNFFCYEANTSTVTPTDTTLQASTSTTTPANRTPQAETSTITPTNPIQQDVDRQRQTILKVKLQSGADLNDKEIQHQILEQMKNTLGPGEANLTVKWRATTKRATNKTMERKCGPVYH